MADEEIAQQPDPQGTPIMSLPAQTVIYTEQTVKTGGDGQADSDAGLGYTEVKLSGAGKLKREINIVNLGPDAVQVLFNRERAKANQAGTPVASGAILNRPLSVDAIYVRSTTTPVVKAQIVVEELLWPAAYVPQSP